MNAKFHLAMAAAFVAGGAASVWAQRVELSQVPAPVRQGIEATRDQGPVKEIVRHVDGGKTVYEVEFDKDNAPNPRMRFAEDGSRVPDPPTMVGVEGEWLTLPLMRPEEGDAWRSTFKVSDLPTPVQEAVRREASGREVADVDQENWNGQTIYEVEFADRGRNPQIHIAEDGTVLREDAAPPNGLKRLFLGTQISDTPPAVQDTIRRITADREIVDIDQRGTKERPVYRVMARRGGAHYEVVLIDQEGRVIGGVAPSRG